MRTLNPTLWRTCRALAGTVRIRLLRELLARPGAGVSTLADVAKIGQSDASQELRRLQSRGLLRRIRQGRHVSYRPRPDPQVPTAAPLLKALKATLTNSPREQDVTICRLATGLAHETRIKIVRELRNGPRRNASLAQTLRLAPNTAHRHVRRLIDAGWIRQQNAWLIFDPPHHPLAGALAKLV